jgi:D-alanyl-D-alanine dipeptidase
MHRMHNNRFFPRLPAVLLCSALWAQAPLHAHTPAAPLSAAAEAADMRDVRSVAAGISVDMRYAGAHNFTGAPVPGYNAPRCYLKSVAAHALAQAQAALAAQGYRLQVLDCYRPVRAVQSFVAWAHAPADPDAKAEYFPRIDKPDLLNGYISATSGHSRGYTVDLTLLDCRSGPCQAMDMGTPFDFFDVRANLGAVGIDAQQQASRALLQQAMQAAGFVPYSMEWWHFSHPAGSSDSPAWDFAVE